MTTSLLAPLCGALFFTTSAQAAVTNVAWYRLGENDPGAASGLAVTNTTSDFVGVNHLKQYGSPLYTNAVSTGASDGVGSSLAVTFNGSSQYLSNAVVSTAVDNFGLEAWVKPNNINPGPHIIAYNGTLFLGGWGIYQAGSGYYASLGPNDIYGAGVSPGIWAHVALVRDNGLSTLYVNGVASGANPITPMPPTGGFALSRETGTLGLFFDGAIDEVRVFTFAPGQFSTNDLLLHRIATLPATGITPTNATLNGRVNPLGFATSAWFEWGTTTNYGNVTLPQAFVTGSTNFSRAVGGLLGGFTYHFRAVASNNFGVVSGTNQSFTVPIFYNINAGLPGVTLASAAWGDYDNDGQLDILLSGFTGSSVICQVWRNTGSGFTNINAGLPGVELGSVAWIDYDHDGWLDIFLAGRSATNNVQIAQIWRNKGGGFTNINASLPGVDYPSAAWGDYDNDGPEDLLLFGLSVILNEWVAQIGRNTRSGVFPVLNQSLPHPQFPAFDWGDYDNDGQLDFLLAVGPVAQVWRNTGGFFTDIHAGLPALYSGSGAWGDYDNDGRPDILLTGTTNGQYSGGISQVWRNTGSGFTNLNAGLPGVSSGSAAWGDYNNDGWLDILLSGGTSNGFVTQVWRNTGTGFAKIDAVLPGITSGRVAWGDYDNDGRLDVLLAGTTNGFASGAIAQVWRNNTPMVNTPPTAPTGLAISGGDDEVVFMWNAASDAQTPANGLTYNLRVGTTPGGSDLVAPMAANSGLRRLPRPGNAQQNWFRRITGIRFTQPVYWSVQAVDGAYAGSPFAAERSFAVSITQPNGVVTPGDVDGDGVVDQGELNTVLSNYWRYSPWLYMTNVAGLGGTNVTFALSNSTAGTFSVEYTTNLLDWLFLGPATPRFLFTDTNAPAEPQRYYRLRWP